MESVSEYSGDQEFDAAIDQARLEVDRTLLRENLRLTPAERLLKLGRFAIFRAQLKRFGAEAKRGLGTS